MTRIDIDILIADALTSIAQSLEKLANPPVPTPTKHPVQEDGLTQVISKLTAQVGTLESQLAKAHEALAIREAAGGPSGTVGFENPTREMPTVVPPPTFDKIADA